MKLKKNDQVIIIKGKDKGKKGLVDKVIPKTNQIIVNDVNKYKKHIKPNAKNPQGGIIDIVKPINKSNAMLICPNCTKQTKINIMVKDGKKIRLCKKCNQSVDIRNKA